MGNMHVQAATSVLSRFLRDAELYQVLTPMSGDFQEATRLLLPRTDLGLRGPDALHLAIAKRRKLTLYDQPLLRAAEALGVSASAAGIGAS
jgi:predicted nucleic acid-binding protein